MRRTAGIAYIMSGLACLFMYVTFVGAMLGMTVPTYSYDTLFIPALFGAGPALLILSGSATVFARFSRPALSAITGATLLVALGLWTVPRIGWRPSFWLLLEPTAGSFLIGTACLLLLKKSWLAALVGSLLSAPFFAFSAGIIGQGILFGISTFSWSPVVIALMALSALLIVASIVFALRMRTA